MRATEEVLTLKASRSLNEEGMDSALKLLVPLLVDQDLRKDFGAEISSVISDLTESDTESVVLERLVIWRRCIFIKKE
ncbi:MAG UNVERIFIED_CONTAM: hypothetical protein LVQ98_08675 [Rickettsiaceae bacterium]|jgi:hypothetical protein